MDFSPSIACLRIAVCTNVLPEKPSRVMMCFPPSRQHGRPGWQAGCCGIYGPALKIGGSAKSCIHLLVPHLGDDIPGLSLQDFCKLVEKFSLALVLGLLPEDLDLLLQRLSRRRHLESQDSFSANKFVCRPSFLPLDLSPYAVSARQVDATGLYARIGRGARRGRNGNPSPGGESCNLILPLQTTKSSSTGAEWFVTAPKMEAGIKGRV